SWTFNSGDRTGYSTYLLPGGTVLRTVVNSGNSFTGGPICGKVQKVSWDGTLLWNYTYSTANYCSHHDIHPMPNGNVLLIAYERRSASEASAMGSTKAIEMWPDKIVEVKPTGATTGEVVWEWKAWDH
ncbi:MAG TPA: aryl-sulfate sulfotransferase, partial [Candidatus Kapabacteria bacterium]|nr:aryl-sulfate sulfotransferase [Candidatus Kapabacteria bacterium]